MKRVSMKSAIESIKSQLEHAEEMRTYMAFNAANDNILIGADVYRDSKISAECYTSKVIALKQVLETLGVDATTIDAWVDVAFWKELEYCEERYQALTK